MNITLPKALLEWVQRQADKQRLQSFQEAIAAGMASGISERSLEDVLSEARGLAAQDSPS